MAIDSIVDSRQGKGGILHHCRRQARSFIRAQEFPIWAILDRADSDHPRSGPRCSCLEASHAVSRFSPLIIAAQLNTIVAIKVISLRVSATTVVSHSGAPR